MNIEKFGGRGGGAAAQPHAPYAYEFTYFFGLPV